MFSISKVLVPALVAAGMTAGSSLQPASAAAPAACTAPDVQASIARAVPVDLPPLMALQSIHTSAIVRLDLDSRGAAANPAIVASSGSAVLDEAARKAALAQTYAPQMHDCAPVPGSYRVVIEFAN